MQRQIRRAGIVLALVVGLGTVLVAGPTAKNGKGKKPEAQPQTFTGKVVPLAGLIAKQGTKLDADAAPFWLALQTADGKVYPLVKDDIARLFFLDKKLLSRSMRLKGRLIPGSGLLRVTAVNSLIKGKLHEVYYWCDICSIRRGEKMTCECCGGPMVLREDPVKE